jgi:hypothetical protein
MPRRLGRTGRLTTSVSVRLPGVARLGGVAATRVLGCGSVAWAVEGFGQVHGDDHAEIDDDLGPRPAARTSDQARHEARHCGAGREATDPLPMSATDLTHAHHWPPPPA